MLPKANPLTKPTRTAAKVHSQNALEASPAWAIRERSALGMEGHASGWARAGNAANGTGRVPGGLQHPAFARHLVRRGGLRVNEAQRAGGWQAVEG